MPYVPGYSNDVFLSYAHGDDPAWIQAFEQALSRAVRTRLGCDVALWQDTSRLRVGLDWQSEIADGIATAAAFVAILTPSYQNSAWCTRELMSFLGPAASPDTVKVGDLYRFFKVVKMPWENNDHELFYSRLQHVPFFRRVEGPQEYVEFPLGSDAFLAGLQETAASITNVLRAMRRSLQTVFVAWPAGDVGDAWERVRAQLRDDRYDVRPEGALNPGYEDKAILHNIEKAILTVHLLGPSYDAFAERQFRLAGEAGKRQLVWFSQGTGEEADVDPKQWALLESIRKREGAASTLDWFPGTVQEMIGQVQTALRPKPVLPDLAQSANPRVYLIHDPTTRKDAAFAHELQSALMEQEKVEVLFPPSGLANASDYHERHRLQLQNSDGVLLYWNEAPDTWLDQYVPDVLFPGRKARVRSKAFLLDDPSQLDPANVPVIHRSPAFRVSDLEPFLKPLRAEANRAGA